MCSCYSTSWWHLFERTLVKFTVYIVLLLYLYILCKKIACSDLVVILTFFSIHVDHCITCYHPREHWLLTIVNIQYRVHGFQDVADGEFSQCVATVFAQMSGKEWAKVVVCSLRNGCSQITQVKHLSPATAKEPVIASLKLKCVFVLDKNMSYSP